MPSSGSAVAPAPRLLRRERRVFGGVGVGLLLSSPCGGFGNLAAGSSSWSCWAFEADPGLLGHFIGTQGRAQPRLLQGRAHGVTPGF